MGRCAVLGMGMVLVSMGCQSYEEGVSVICNAPESCEECSHAPPTERQSQLASYIDSHLSNEDAQDLFHSLASMPPDARAQALREAANATRNRDCRMAEMLAAAPRQ